MDLEPKVVRNSSSLYSGIFATLTLSYSRGTRAMRSRQIIRATRFLP